MQRLRALSVLLLLTGLSLGLAAHAQPQGGMGGGAQDTWLGVTARDVSFDRLASLGLELGVEAVDVAQNSPASAAGLQSGDILVELNGKPVYSVDRLRWLVAQAGADAKVPVTYLRGGDRATTDVRLAARPSMAPLGAPPSQPWQGAQQPSRSYLGVQLQTMTDDLRQAFGAGADRGVLIAQVVAGGPAGQAGLEAGDVIVRMERKPIRTVEDIYSVLGFYDPGTEIEVEVIRQQESKTVTVTLGQPPAGQQQGQQNWPQWRQPPHMPVPIPDPGYFQTPMNQFFQRWQDLWRQGPGPGTPQPGAVAEPAPGQSL